jgi:ribosomal protein S18 acetylase RimI-like enzyme
LKSIHIFHVFINRENRGEGYSKLLVNKALEYAKTNQIDKITLAVIKSNPVAIGLYQKYGFELVGENKTGSFKMELKLP